ncbi:hypothetical protein BM527_02430 [Alteromonas sp. Mex14]|nr:hypothetical protein BM527_02430 [Alteromonas sp. Mex14]
MYASFKEMPPVLKFLTGIAIFFVFLFLKATVLGMFGTFTYNGEVLEFNEIWERGFGVPLIIIGLLMPQRSNAQHSVHVLFSDLNLSHIMYKWVAK